MSDERDYVDIVLASYCSSTHKGDPRYDEYEESEHQDHIVEDNA